MKKNMKYRFRIILFLSILTLLCHNIDLFAQTTPIKGYVDELDTIIRILTPLGNQLNNEQNEKEVVLNEWTENELEFCYQNWFYDGGIFMQDGNCSFTEKNIFLKNRHVNCILINGNTIFAGTDDGIYKSTNLGDEWLFDVIGNEDGIDNLNGLTPAIKINALKYGFDKIFACTSNGIYISSDDCENWSEVKMEGMVVNCIEFGNGDDIFVGTVDNGIYKSTNEGDNWESVFVDDVQGTVNCLVFFTNNDDNIILVGTYEYLLRSEDYGSTWVIRYSEEEVKSLAQGSAGIYFGTITKGFFKSTNVGLNFYAYNSEYPEISLNTKYTLNSILEIGGIIYIATDNGLYKSITSEITWTPCGVRSHIDVPEDVPVEKTKMLYNNGGDLWVACFADLAPWGDAELITNGQYILSPEYYGNFNCHGYAWHLSEGGQRCVAFPTPNLMKYIRTDAPVQNWDYIETLSPTDPYIEKVTFGNATNGFTHSCTKSQIGNENITNIEDIYFESKWTHKGPLVRHNLKDNPWSDDTKRYWKSKKEVSGPITGDVFIGRQIITNGNTTIPAGNTVSFYTGPMKDHKIHLKDGFHAKSGSTFHAYIKDTYQDGTSGTKPCEIPWEEVIRVQAPILSGNNSNKLYTDSNLIISDNVSKRLFNYPEKIIYDTCRIDNRIFKFSGKGSGTKDDPFQITTLNQLKEMTKDHYYDNYYVLMNDIDATETRYWNPDINSQGDTIGYMGFPKIHGSNINSLDGRGHIIKNLYAHTGNGGSFSVINPTNCFTLKRIGFVDCLAECHGPFNFFVVGVDSKDFIMDECYFTGKIILGEVEERSISCALGWVYSNTLIKNSYTDFEIVTDSVVSNFGYFLPSDTMGQIKNCYALGQNSSSRVLSPFGYNGNVVSCFWDADKIKVTNDSLGLGQGLSTAEMMKRSTFESAGWDFENVWYIEEGMDYPKLKCFRDGVGVEEKEPVKSGIAEMSITGNSDKIKIDYTLPTPGQVRIKIFNSLGALEGVIFEGFSQLSDSGSTQFDASPLASGMYFITLESAGIRLCRQYALIK